MTTFPEALEERLGFRECFSQYMTIIDADDSFATTLDKARDSVNMARTLKLETRMCAMLFHKKHAIAVKKKKVEDALAEFQGHCLDASTHTHPTLWEAVQNMLKGDDRAEEPPQKKQKGEKSEKKTRRSGKSEP